ncbi:MAG: efflux RND transporter permease subunit [Gemmatimonadetes bacterium]|nr:efflux RND transporter permease subunit [Gemmatimonadota bacterium]
MPYVPLSQVATVTAGMSPARIDHYQRRRVVTVGATVLGASMGTWRPTDAPGRVDPAPAGYRISEAGQVESQNEMFRAIITALSIAVMLMYLILVVRSSGASSSRW